MSRRRRVGRVARIVDGCVIVLDVVADVCTTIGEVPIVAHVLWGDKIWDENFGPIFCRMNRWGR